MSHMVLTVGPGHTLREVARLMSERNVGAAVVMDPDGHGPGIITERDILVSIGAGEDPDGEGVAEHLTRDVVFAAPDWSLEEAAAAMVRGELSPPDRARAGGDGRHPVGPRRRQVVAAGEPGRRTPFARGRAQRRVAQTFAGGSLATRAVHRGTAIGARCPRGVLRTPATMRRGACCAQMGQPSVQRLKLLLRAGARQVNCSASLLYTRSPPLQVRGLVAVTLTCS